MALISIKGRKDPIQVSNDTARKIKRRWLGDFDTGAGKADKFDVVDLGDWAGEYGQIKSIELDKVSMPVTTKAVMTPQNTVKIVALNYELQEGERLA